MISFEESSIIINDFDDKPIYILPLNIVEVDSFATVVQIDEVSNSISVKEIAEMPLDEIFAPLSNCNDYFSVFHSINSKNHLLLKEVQNKLN